MWRWNFFISFHWQHCEFYFCSAAEYQEGSEEVLQDLWAEGSSEPVQGLQGLSLVFLSLICAAAASCSVDLILSWWQEQIFFCWFSRGLFHMLHCIFCIQMKLWFFSVLPGTCGQAQSHDGRLSSLQGDSAGEVPGTEECSPGAQRRSVVLLPLVFSLYLNVFYFFLFI